MRQHRLRLLSIAIVIVRNGLETEALFPTSVAEFEHVLGVLVLHRTTSQEILLYYGRRLTAQGLPRLGRCALSRPATVFEQYKGDAVPRMQPFGATCYLLHQAKGRHSPIGSRSDKERYQFHLRGFPECPLIAASRATQTSAREHSRRMEGRHLGYPSWTACARCACSSVTVAQ